MERQSRLAHSLLADDHYRSAVTRTGPAPAIGQQVKLMSPSDKG